MNSSRTVCEVYEWNDALTGSDPEKCFKEAEGRSLRIWDFDIEGMLGEAREGFERRVEGMGDEIKGEGEIDGMSGGGMMDDLKAEGVKGTYGGR